MPVYELVFIISPEVAEDDLQKSIDKVSESISKLGGSMSDVNKWGKKKLAFPLKRFSEGNYVLAKVDLKPASIKELEANLRLSDEVLRHLLIKI